jgi:4-amino-4-deoxy-L-arabinose transferase-like glycosyltransferase
VGPLSRTPVALGAIVAGAAALRLATLGLQSFWYDESYTAAIAVQASLGDVLASAWDLETTPPTYYLLLWLWQELAGESDVALRLLSALAGIATVPIAYALGARLHSARAGLIAAALTATSPLLLTFSQENRPYALLALIGAASMLLLLRAVERPRAGRLAAWAAVCAAGIAVHYFAAFVVAPQAVWLLWSTRRGRGRVGPGARHATPGPLLACAGVGVAALALAPAALHQQAEGGTDWITGAPLAERVEDVGHQFVKGIVYPPSPLLGYLAIALVATGIVMLAVRLRGARLRAAVVALGIGAAAMALPLLVSLAGVDVLLFRNLIAAWVPLAVVLAIGFAAAGRGGIVASVCLVATWLGIWGGILTDDTFQRDDWEGIAAVLGEPREQRVLVVEPGHQEEALERYGHTVEGFGAGPDRTREIVSIGAFDADLAPPTLPGLPGFRLVERRQVQRMGLARYRAPSTRSLGGGVAEVAPGSRAYIEPAPATPTADDRPVD